MSTKNIVLLYVSVIVSELLQYYSQAANLHVSLCHLTALLRRCNGKLEQ
jgi:hypothetical protein